jgi:fibronectin type 3 domain-containing protein
MPRTPPSTSFRSVMVLGVVLLGTSAFTKAQGATPVFVQVNSAVPQSTSVPSVVVTFNGAQTAGNLNLVTVGWNDTQATIASVTDTAGNLYVRAVGPTLGSGLSQSIYYAKNIVASAAGANRVTVTFSPAAQYPDVRILEYAGIDPANPVDNSAAAAGNSAMSDSGVAVTGNPTDLLVGANMVLTSTAGPGSGFTSRVITSPDGDIAEDRLVTATGSYNATAPLSSSGAWIMQMVALRAAGSQPPGPDIIPPTVSITSPTNGATVTGIVTLAASASDNVGVVGVQFKVDGSNLGAEVTTPPYSVTWDTSVLAAGTSHTLAAVARDAAANTSISSPVTVTVQTAATLGQWQGPFAWPMVAVHMNLMPNGKVLLFDGQSLGALAQVWSPVSNTFTPVTAPDNVFCSGHTSLADGKVFVVGGHIGGHIGLNGSYIFDFQSQSWALGPTMSSGRWYPTATTLSDGRVIALSGESNCNGCFVTQPEIYDPATNSWTPLSNAKLSFPYYPHAFVLPDGRVLVSSTTEAPIISRVLDLNGQKWTGLGSSALDGGTAAMYRPGKILKAGTSVDPDTAVRQSVSTAYVLDMMQSSPAWRQVASMAFRRTYATMVLLPDGNVFVEGGGVTTDATDVSGAVLPAEIWSPPTETWTTVASMATPRLYHSTALLMPDGRVLVAGGGRFNSASESTDQPSAEYYLPPYLFKGSRPTITAAPSMVQIGQTFFVQTPNAAQIGSVVLMRIGSVTHNFNMSQNYVPLIFQVATGGLNVQGPPNSNLAPPGYYMLFIVTTGGIPSVAPIVNLSVGSSTTQPPTAPTNLVATGGNASVSLGWSASTGPNGVSGYSVYRATAPSVAPILSNRIAQTTSTTYIDANFPASETYYYVVTASDPLGNESAPSNEVAMTVTADVSPPTDPTNLTATAVSNSQINLSWIASTDNIGVTGYPLERCQGASCTNFAQFATTSSPSFSDIGLAASTSYSYRVRAKDAAGNLSGYSNVASATTAAAPPQPSTPVFVQQNYAVPQSSAINSVSVTFKATQTAGNLNLVVVSWNDTQAAVASLTDTSRNVYTRAVGPTLGSALTQSIYYAKNIVPAAAGANRVTVTFSPAARYPDVRILEYNGIDSTAPVDTSAAAVGNSASSSSGAAVTTNATDLLVGANVVATSTSGPGAGFSSRVITKPNGDIVEDRVVTTAGTYTATGPLKSAGPWVMQLLALRAAGSPPPAARTIESGLPPP